MGSVGDENDFFKNSSPLGHAQSKGSFEQIQLKPTEHGKVEKPIESLASFSNS